MIITRYILFCVLSMMAIVAKAEVYVFTNDVAQVTNVGASISFDKQLLARISVYGRLGSFSLPLNLTSNYTIRWEWRDVRDRVGFTNFVSGRILDGSNGYVSAETRLDSIDIGDYEAELWAYLNGQRGHRLAWNAVSVTNATAVGGMSVIINEPIGITSTGGTIAVTQTGTNYNLESTVGPGGGGEISINGHDDDAFNFYGAHPVVVSNIGSSIYIGLVSLQGGVITTPDTTNRVYFYYLTSTTHTYTVPISVTNIDVWAWGAGSGYPMASTINGGGGGFSYAKVPVTPGEALTVFVGQGGMCITGGATYTLSDSAFPSGGRGIARQSASIAYGGGGRTELRRGTNTLVVAGGGGGGVVSSGSYHSGGDGGGLTGEDSSGGSSGLGGGGAGINAGGTTATNSISAFWTNTVGSALAGGDGGATTNITNGSAGGGGDGWFGGGGGFSGSTTLSRGGGGGGSGFVRSNLTFAGVSYRAANGYPVGQELPEYIAGAGVSAGSTTHGTRGGNGLLVIGY